MSKALYGFLLVAAMAVFTSCNRNSPRQVAETWLTAFHHMDADAALKHSAPATKTLIYTLSSLSGPIADSTRKELEKIKISIKDIQETNDKATVTYTTSDNPKERKINLVRQSDKWYVLFTKVDLAAEMSSNEEEELQEEVPVSDSTAPAANVPVQQINIGQ